MKTATTVTVENKEMMRFEDGEEKNDRSDSRCVHCASSANKDDAHLFS